MSKLKSYYLPLCVMMGFTIAVAAMLSACNSSSLVQSVKKESLYARVLRTGKIRCAYGIYPPWVIKDPNSGKFSGIGVEVLDLAAKKLGLKVEIAEEVGWGTVLEGIDAGRYDTMICPLWTNPSRAKRAAFSRAVFYTPIFVYARIGDDRFDEHLEKINSNQVIISTVDGETAEVTANEEFPKAKRFSMPQMTDITQNFLNVSTGKADIAMCDADFASRYMKNNPNSIKRVGDKPIRIFPNCYMFKRGEFEFKSMLDTVLDEIINSGELQKIADKYAPGPNSVWLVSLPYRLPLNAKCVYSH